MLDISAGTQTQYNIMKEKCCASTVFSEVRFFLLNTQTFSILLSFLTLAFLTRMSPYASNPSVVCCQRMTNKEGELLGDNGKKTASPDKCPDTLWRQLGE